MSYRFQATVDVIGCILERDRTGHDLSQLHQYETIMGMIVDCEQTGWLKRMASNLTTI